MTSDDPGTPGPAAAWLRRYGYHLLFGVSLVSLAALLAWWSVFIRTAIDERYQLGRRALADRGRGYAMYFGHQAGAELGLGRLAQDSDFEVVPCAGEPAGRLAVPLLPYHPGQCIRPRPEVVQELDTRFRRQKVMLIGESSVLALVLLVCLFMLYQMVRMERQAARELREFWGRATHEIKTPITGIKAFLQTLQTQALSPGELAPLVALALRQVERQEMLTENVLVGQRLERGGRGLFPRPLDPTVFVAGFLESHRVLLAGATVETDSPPPGRLSALADPDALRVICENLLDNALKYAGQRMKLSVSVAEEGETGRIVIRVADNGPGFDPGQAGTIFDAYRRLRDELPAGPHGTGMGLHISRSLARRMGGDLTAASAGRGLGAAFSIHLKRASGG